jgi:hypothetical protein
MEEFGYRKFSTILYKVFSLLHKLTGLVNFNVKLYLSWDLCNISPANTVLKRGYIETLIFLYLFDILLKMVFGGMAKYG